MCIFVFAQALTHCRKFNGNALVGTLGGLVGSFAVVVGLMFVHKIGAGTLAGLTIAANIIMSLIIDKYGMFGMQPHPLSIGRIAGGVLMVGGIYLISKF